MTTQQSVDQAKTEAFLGKVLTDTSGMTTTIMASIGDRLGLFKQLAHGPATSAQLATRADINERYAREWLGALATWSMTRQVSVSRYPPSTCRCWRRNMVPSSSGAFTRC